MKPYIFLTLITVFTSTYIHACSNEKNLIAFNSLIAAQEITPDKAIAAMNLVERAEFKNKLSILHANYTREIDISNDQMCDVLIFLKKHGAKRISWHPRLISLWLKEIERIEKETTK